MSKVYFVSHAKPDFSIVDDYSCPLTEEGCKGYKKVTGGNLIVQTYFLEVYII